MKLNKLELYGFKSFADRTVFEFEDSFSALVGPNGAGKSNIADAIKWVLGERSAQKLRGVEMANVIFNGSRGRKPVNFAEVKLTIDNSDGWLPVDYEEVCIRRRVDRTGQSDFFLNGRPCRLKDVRQLLLDTGIGTGCYGMIEQGQIDRILRSSPKERRQVFEEAAGINRFLEQKRETERKLDRVTSNLARIGDIVEEVDHQLRSVKYQAGRARTFKQQSERLHRLRLADSLHTHRQFSRQRQEHAQKTQSLLREKTRLDREHAAADAGLESGRSELQRVQSELAEARQRLTRADARLDSLEREGELNRKRHDELQHQLDEISRRRANLEERSRALDSEISAATAKLQQVAQELTEKSDRFEGVRADIENIRSQCKHAEQTREAQKETVFDLFQRESQLRNQIEVLAAENRTLVQRRERAENRRQELAEQVSRADDERSRVHDRLEALQAEQSQLAEQVEKLRRALAEAQERADAASSQESEARAELSARVARLELLKDLEARAEGVHSGVKKLLEAGLPGTVGLVAEALEVSPELAVAVEAALGGRVQAVIFGTAEQAREAMHLLARDGGGHAELIVLALIPQRVRVELPAAPGLRGRLCELINCDPSVAPAIQFLLGNTFLVHDGDAVAAILQAGLPQGARLVTLAGECYDADGVWSAGVPGTSGLISRRTELAELRAQVARCREQLAELSRRKQSCFEQVRELEAQRAPLAVRLEELKRSSADARGLLQVISKRADDLQEELQPGRVEEAAIREDIRAGQAQKEQLEAKSEQAQQARAAAQQSAQAEQQRMRSMLERQQALADEVNTLSGDLARCREQHRGVQSLLERLRSDRQSGGAELAALLSEHEANAQRREEAGRALESAQAEQQSLQKEKQDLQQALAGESAALQTIQQKIAGLTERCRGTAQQREELDERLHAVRMAETETSIKMQDMLERVADDCGVRLQALEMEPERWNQEPPFTAKVIREFCEEMPQEPPAEPVAAWYRELETIGAGRDAEGEAELSEPGTEEGPETIGLQEATELRRAVLELADDPATDWNAMKAEIASLRSKVSRIGNVNVGAIRQQEQLEMRLQFMTDQKEDLEKARRHEREIIRQLNKKSREKFGETFELIRQNFRALFRKLFGGGVADLVLDGEEEDILEAGIEIIARPPGKQADSISLLSGGERAMTAVALLFAIFQAKPSPFCLLDEVDAPLDDNNVERFLTLLEEFRRDTQFIVITHNKLTMSVAQILYGLTMTDGVSKKISVKFEEVDRRLKAKPLPRAKAG